MNRLISESGSISLEGGLYRATVAVSARTYEAWTESLPFVYGRARSTLAGALESLHEEFLRAGDTAGRGSSR